MRRQIFEDSLYSVFSEKITIYSYKSEASARQAEGTPVALNFSDSNCFLKCCKDGDKVLLKVEVCTLIVGVIEHTEKVRFNEHLVSEVPLVLFFDVVLLL